MEVNLLLYLCLVMLVQGKSSLVSVTSFVDLNQTYIFRHVYVTEKQHFLSRLPSLLLNQMDS